MFILKDVFDGVSTAAQMLLELMLFCLQGGMQLFTSLFGAITEMVSGLFGAADPAAGTPLPATPAP